MNEKSIYKTLSAPCPWLPTSVWWKPYAINLFPYANVKIISVSNPQGDLDQVQGDGCNLIILCNVLMVSLSLSTLNELSQRYANTDTDGPKEVM